MRIGLMADPEDPEARRLADLLDAAFADGPLALLRARPTVVWVRLPPRDARRARWWGALAGAVGAVHVPVGPPDGPPPSGFARWVVSSQEDATAWVAAGVPIGRVVVVAESGARAALAAVSAEVASMGRRPEIGHPNDGRRRSPRARLAPRP